MNIKQKVARMWKKKNKFELKFLLIPLVIFAFIFAKSYFSHKTANGVMESAGRLGQQLNELSMSEEGFNKSPFIELIPMYQSISMKLNEEYSSPKFDENSPLHKAHDKLVSVIKKRVLTEDLSVNEMTSFLKSSFEAQKLMGLSPDMIQFGFIKLTDTEFTSVIRKMEHAAKENNAGEYELLVIGTWYHEQKGRIDDKRAKEYWVKAWQKDANSMASIFMASLYNEFNEPENTYLWSLRAGTECIKCKSTMLQERAEQIQEMANSKSVLTVQ